MKSRCSDLRNWVYQDPTKFIRYGVLFVCCIVVTLQLYECFSKLRKPPIGTHSFFQLNDTIEMPAVTICREPPYKGDVVSKLFNNHLCNHPKYPICWETFDFNETDVNEVFTDGTYNFNEVMRPFYGLDSLPSSIEVTSSIQLNYGQCHTLRPLKSLINVSKKSGYSLPLLHDQLSDDDGGWHLFFHELNENFTEIQMKASGRWEYIFVEVGEEIEIKLQTQHFQVTSTIDADCSDAYSDLQCGEFCAWLEVVTISNCSAPWMPGIDLPTCDNYESMKLTINEYKKRFDNFDEELCQCLKPCHSIIFSTFVQNRKKLNDPRPYAQVFIYYTSKLISMIQERPTYDVTQFVADMGGSLGFLLGLSVLGVIGILEHITLVIFGSLIRKMQLKNEERLQRESSEQLSHSSESTFDASYLQGRGIDKY